MKVTVRTPDRAGAVVRGHIASTRAASSGITVTDGTTEVDGVTTVIFDSALVSDLDDGTVLVTVGGTELLVPTSDITATKAAGNPTFDGDFIPEDVIKVGSTYYCIGQTWTTSPWQIHLWTATAVAGPWTAYGSNPIYELSDVPWALGTANEINAPGLVLDAGTYYLFYSVLNSTTGQDGKIGLATASAITGPYTDHGAPIVSEGAPSSNTSLQVGEASVIHFGGQWIMALMAEDEDFAFQLSEKIYIYTAALPSGPWTIGNSGNPIIDHGANGEWDDDMCADPFLFAEGGRYWIMYSGGGSEGGTGTRKWHLGLAYADDPGGPWTKHTSNPILSASSSGWDEMAAWRGSLYEDGNIWHGVYGGLNSALSVAKGGNFVLDIVSAETLPLRADDIPIDDAGGYFTGSEVETALQEIGAILDTPAGAGGHYEVIVDGTAPPIAVTNIAEDDWLYGFVAD